AGRRSPPGRRWRGQPEWRGDPSRCRRRPGRIAGASLAPSPVIAVRGRNDLCIALPGLGTIDLGPPEQLAYLAGIAALAALAALEIIE
ncbi:MAG TPA: hypothetical protein VJ757_16840, partial [Pseudonocardiaceae bacterium]|nr:hypothetical protein [Pseudonocardiaceae bacterium]